MSRKARRITGALALATVGCIALIGLGWAPDRPSGPEELRADALVGDAIDLMGGPALRSVARVKLSLVTQWQRTDYRAGPLVDRPSFERHTDLRDYRIPAWRNTRLLSFDTIVNIVRDSVAATRIRGSFRPQSVAYVDEREELFLYTPDRLILALSEAPDLKLTGDTLIGEERHHLVNATLRQDFPVSVALHSTTHLPRLLRFRQAHPNDFGLAPFGVMEVEVWYSGWRSFGEVTIPTQWDIWRAGAPYKRMTVRSADFDPDFAAADSFHISPKLRSEYLDARAPMHDVPVDSVTAVGPDLWRVHGIGSPAGAARVDGGWVFLGAGHTPLNLQRARTALAEAGVEGIRAAIVAAASPGNGGGVELAREGVPIYTSTAAQPFLDVTLTNAGMSGAEVRVIAEDRWVGDGEGRLLLTPVDLPDVPGSLVVYSPRGRWLYAPDAVTRLDRRIVQRLAGERGWSVERVGGARGLGFPPALGW